MNSNHLCNTSFKERENFSFSSSQSSSGSNGTQFLLESKKNCPFCPKLFISFEKFLMINRALYIKYSSSQNFYYIKEINKFLDPTNIKNIKERTNIVNFNDQVAKEDSTEYLTDLLLSCESEQKTDYLTEYYKFHREIPRIFQHGITKIFNKYHNKKRRIQYYKIKRLLNETDTEHSSHSSYQNNKKALEQNISNQKNSDNANDSKNINLSKILNDISELKNNYQQQITAISPLIDKTTVKNDFKYFQAELDKQALIAPLETSIYSLDGKPSLNSYSAYFIGDLTTVNEFDNCFQEILQNFQNNQSIQDNETQVQKKIRNLKCKIKEASQENTIKLNERSSEKSSKTKQEETHNKINSGVNVYQMLKPEATQESSKNRSNASNTIKNQNQQKDLAQQANYTSKLKQEDETKIPDKNVKLKLRITQRVPPGIPQGQSFIKFLLDQQNSAINTKQQQQIDSGCKVDDEIIKIIDYTKNSNAAAVTQKIALERKKLLGQTQTKTSSQRNLLVQQKKLFKNFIKMYLVQFKSNQILLKDLQNKVNNLVQLTFYNFNKTHHHQQIIIHGQEN